MVSAGGQHTVILATDIFICDLLCLLYPFIVLQEGLDGVGGGTTHSDLGN